MSQTFCNTRVEPEEELLQCPYDPVHRILPKRMQTHLIKCRKAILGQPTSPYYQLALNMVVCKFNSKHHVQKDQLDAHHFKCPDKKEFFSNVATVQSTDAPETKPGWMNLIDETALKKQPAGDEESWEDEWQQTYDPMEKINSNTDIIYNPQGLSKAKKRDYAINRRLQAEGLLDSQGNMGNGDDWGDNDGWETNNIVPRTNKPSSPKPKSNSNNDWSDKDSWNNPTSKSDKKTPSEKLQNGVKTKSNKGGDGWTEVAPRFRKYQPPAVKDEWDNATRSDDWGCDSSNPSSAAKTNGFGHPKTNDDDWGLDTTSYNNVGSNSYGNTNQEDEWESEIATFAGNTENSSALKTHSFTSANSKDIVDDGGGWDDGPSINPYLNQPTQTINNNAYDDETGWEATEEYTPEPYVDEWGTVIGSDPKEIMQKINEKQQLLKVESTEAWGGDDPDAWSAVSIVPSQNSEKPMALGGGKNKSKLSANALSFEPPGYPTNSKLSPNAMEFTPPGLSSEESVRDEHTVMHKESITSTDTDTPSGFEENDSDQDDIPPPPGFHRAPPSISGSSEASFNAPSVTGDKAHAENEDEDNTFSHNVIELKHEVESVEVELEEPKKIPSVKVPVQQNNQLTQRKQQKRRGGGGRRRKGENRNSKVVDSTGNTSSFSTITSLAVKCCGMSIVIGLFVVLYLISVVILLSFSNP